MPTEQDVRDHVRQMQSIGSEEAMASAAEAERELERSRLDHLRESGDDSPEREGLEKAYPKHKPRAAADADEPPPVGAPTADLEKGLKRDQLDERASALGLDPSDYSDKGGIAAAIHDKETEG